MQITEQQIEGFHEDGFIILDRILADEQVTRAREAVERCFQGEYNCDRRPQEYRHELSRLEEGETKIGQIIHGRLLDSDLWDIMTSAHIGQILAALMRTSLVSLTEDQLFKKPPHSPPIAMHQDYPYQTFARNSDLTTCWIALTDLTPETSPLEYIRGSHKWPTAPMPSHFSDGSETDYFEAAEPFRKPGEEFDVTQVIVPAGGGAVHFTKTTHGSPENASSEPRLAIAMHHAMESCRADTSKLMWHSSMWEGVEDGGAVANEYMPIVYSEE